MDINALVSMYDDAGWPCQIVGLRKPKPASKFQGECALHVLYAGNLLSPLPTAHNCDVHTSLLWCPSDENTLALGKCRLR